MHPTTGIHHISAIASSPQATYDFYAGLLGLRLVKKTVNQDQTEAYHLFFGDRLGNPGMDLTFFTFEPVAQGQHGVGQVDTIALSVPASALEWWEARFQEHDVAAERVELFGMQRLRFEDFDGQRLELVGVSEAELPDDRDVWETAEIARERAIPCFFAARLVVADRVMIDAVLEQVLGYEETKRRDTEHASIAQLQVRDPAIREQGRAVYLEIEERDSRDHGRNAAGTVHHIAFGVRSDQHQKQLQEQVLRLGLRATPVIDRYYFRSVYFRTKAGILFELATHDPGFTVDEDESALGQELALPPFLEQERAEIEARLTPIHTQTTDTKEPQ